MKSLSKISETIKYLNKLLDEKLNILTQIFNICENQKMFVENLEDEESLNNYFSMSLEEKQNLIDELKIIDDNFLKSFEGFGGELNKNKDLFKYEINNMQSKIQEINSLDNKIKLQEQSNKTLFENINKNKQIKTLKANKNYILNKYSENTKKSY